MGWNLGAWGPFIGTTQDRKDDEETHKKVREIRRKVAKITRRSPKRRRSRR